jgi:hypothetical protein
MDEVRSGATAVDAVPVDFKPTELLTRRQLAAALTERGLPIAPATLAAMAVRGAGPPFQVWGRRPLYSLESALAWARGRLNATRRQLPAGDTAAGQHAVA